MNRSSSSSTGTIGQRLKFAMKKSGMNSAELARHAGVKTSFLYDVISGKSANPSTIKLVRVAEALGISLNELAGGQACGLPNDYIGVPRLAVNAAGNSSMTQEAATEPYYFCQEWIRTQLGATPEDLRLFAVRGDSMEPTLCHNDRLLIDTSKTTPSPPGIFAIHDGFGLAVKRLEFVGKPPKGKLRILSDNPQYSVYERSPEEAAVIGRVIWFSREI